MIGRADSYLIELVEKIYAAAADPACWRETLDSLVTYFDGRGAITHDNHRAGSGFTR
jgi:hypothetical protein